MGAQVGEPLSEGIGARVTYRVRRITNEADLLELEDAWTDLLLSAEESTVFASFQWNVAWWRHFGAGAALHVVTVCAGDRLVGLAPLMVRRFGPVRKLEFVATGLSDYGDFLVHPDF